MHGTQLDFEAIRWAVIEQIEEFCSAHKLTPAKFGALFANDNKFVDELRFRGVGLTTLATVGKRANEWANL